MAKYKVERRNLSYKGEVYQAGDTITLPDHASSVWLRLGWVSEIKPASKAAAKAATKAAPKKAASKAAPKKTAQKKAAKPIEQKEGE
jgi:hypothetical protein